MTDVLAILIWPDNNKFDVIPVDKDFEAGFLFSFSYKYI